MSIKDRAQPYKLIGPRDRRIGTLLFQRCRLDYDVYNLRGGKWYWIGALDVLDRYPCVESDEQLVARAKALAERRHETLEGL